MAHCTECCLRLSLNKDKTLPRHYLEATGGWLGGYGPQEQCRGSNTTKYVADRQLGRPCRRPLSGHTCPCCGRKPLTLNKNGKYPKHHPPKGGECQLSQANSR